MWRTCESRGRFFSCRSLKRMLSCWRNGCRGLILAVAAATGATAAGADATASTPAAPAAADPDGADLRREVADLREEVRDLREERARDAERLEALGRDAWFRRFTLGGYGEMHANFGEGSTPDLFDFHRFVIYLGYDFASWIRLHSEIELEHAFVSDGSDGELSLEQLLIDFRLREFLNVRVGRVLTPLGIINKVHEPTRFNGVERPTFDRVIIPTTWPSDGAGVYGRPIPWLAYEAYVVGGLDGSEFNATSGIRGGRMLERPGLHEPAVTGRIDLFPLAEIETAPPQSLRLGASAYAGGLDNGNAGRNPGIHGDIQIYSGDIQYSICRLDLRGVFAYEAIDGARSIGNGTASGIFGWYVEAAYHVWPEAWKKGKLAGADGIVFIRHDVSDTQYDRPSGVSKNKAGDRREWTAGVGFYLTPQFVVKADYQVRDDARSKRLDDLFNVGVGWMF